MEQKGKIEHVTGLRGLAALLLVLFYLNREVWVHGYLGIDIFLVVTGYLLFSSRRAFNGNESLRDGFFFMVRRLQKIIPPTAIIILLSVVAGACLLWWEDELYLSELGLNACLARANVMIAGESENYLSSISTFMPLRHLWYISALVQIYLLWCVGNQLLQKRPQGQIVGVLSIVAVASLVCWYSFPVHEWLARGGLHLWEQDAPVSYVRTFPRLWEVLMGGVVTLMPSLKEHRIWATLTALAGLLLMLAAALAGTIPGTEALAELPGTLMMVVGTVLVIRYLPTSGMNILLTNRVLLWLGGVSFSLFLVSMPVIAFGRLWTFGEPSPTLQLVVLALLLLLAWGLRKGVEKREVLPEVTLGLWVGAFLLCGAGMLMDGFKNYVPSVAINIPSHPWQLCRDDRLRDDWNPALNFSQDVFKFLNTRGPKSTKNLAPLLVLGDQNRRCSVALIGDSHAAHLYAGLNKYFQDDRICGVFVSSSFYPFHNWQADNNEAKEKAMLAWLRRHPQITHVIIAQRWLERLKNVRRLSGQQWATEQRFEIDFRSFLEDLRDMNKHVLVVAPSPEFDMKPLQHYSKVLSFRGKQVADIAPVCEMDDYMERNGEVLRVLEKMEKEKLCTLLRPLDALPKGVTSFLAASANTLLMYDYNHMYAEHAVFLIEGLASKLRDFLGIAADRAEYTRSRKNTNRTQQIQKK